LIACSACSEKRFDWLYWDCPAALRRFKRECERNGILKEIKRREHYLSPSLRRKLKAPPFHRVLITDDFNGVFANCDAVAMPTMPA